MIDLDALYGPLPILLHLEMTSRGIVRAYSDESGYGVTEAILGLGQDRLADAWERGYRHLAVWSGRWPL